MQPRSDVTAIPSFLLAFWLYAGTYSVQSHPQQPNAVDWDSLQCSKNSHFAVYCILDRLKMEYKAVQLRLRFSLTRTDSKYSCIFFHRASVQSPMTRMWTLMNLSPGALVMVNGCHSVVATDGTLTNVY